MEMSILRLLSSSFERQLPLKLHPGELNFLQMNPWGHSCNQRTIAFGVDFHATGFHNIHGRHGCGAKFPFFLATLRRECIRRISANKSFPISRPTSWQPTKTHKDLSGRGRSGVRSKHSLFVVIRIQPTIYFLQYQMFILFPHIPLPASSGRHG